MKQSLLIALLLSSLHSFAFAGDIPGQSAMDAFIKIQNEKSDSTLNAQISELIQSGFTERGSTSAMFLSGMCGVAGCSSTYLVSTTYYDQGSNRPTTVVVAIVSDTPHKGIQVHAILSRAEIENLVNHK